MSNVLTTSIRATAVTLVLTGLVYPLVVWGIAQAAFPRQADGSIVTNESGAAIGSDLIGQDFADPAYVWGRPSAAGTARDGHGVEFLVSGGSNLGPTSKKLHDDVAARVEAMKAGNPAAKDPIPAELVTTSASGVDPHLSPESVEWQVPRIASARGVSEDRVRAVFAPLAEGRTLGLLGEPRLNVLAANLALNLSLRTAECKSEHSAEVSSASTPPARSRSEDFLELVQRSKRGHLKLYVGFAAGVGKTYRMLEEAHALRKRGVDVVLAFVETHGRADTAALVAGLEIVPRRGFEYRGVTVEDMDVDAVLARRPEIAVVDEIPHTNAPGSRNRRRWQDVENLLAAGINVIGAMNVQHLESLKDIVERTTGVTIRETVPDSFLKSADQIVNLDLAIEDLRERLRSGKIYAPDKIESALAHFFRPENLGPLRELALREVADSLGRSGAEHSAHTADERGGATLGRVLVCMASNSPRAAELLRRGSRIAGKLSTSWFVVYVETPDETPERIDATAQRHLHANIELARELGAEVVRLRGRDPVAVILDFARSHNVGHVVIGRSRQPWWRRPFKKSVPQRFIDEARDLDVQFIADPDPGDGA